MTKALQHVGVTRTGKAVHLPTVTDEQQPDLPAECALYTPAEHFDSYAVFEYLLSRELSRTQADTGVLRMYEGMSFCHRAELGDDRRRAEQSALGLATIFDVIEHGKGLADCIFKD